MLKTFGMFMILFACFAFSYIKAGELKQKYENLKQMKKALSMMKSEISFTSKALSETADELSALLTGDVSFFFKSVSRYLSENETADFGTAWEYAKKLLQQRPFLFPAAEKIVTDFSKRVGKMSMEIELENIDGALAAIDRELMDEGELYARNRKLIFTLGVGAGLAVSIFFI